MIATSLLLYKLKCFIYSNKMLQCKLQATLIYLQNYSTIRVTLHYLKKLLYNRSYATVLTEISLQYGYATLLTKLLYDMSYNTLLTEISLQYELHYTTYELTLRYELYNTTYRNYSTIRATLHYLTKLLYNMIYTTLLTEIMLQCCYNDTPRSQRQYPARGH